MPVNHAKLQKHEENIALIDAAIHKAELFTDRKEWLDLGEGRKLLHVSELEALRSKEEAGMREASRS